jgi:hypothetical protein
MAAYGACAAGELWLLCLDAPCGDTLIRQAAQCGDHNDEENAPFALDLFYTTFSPIPYRNGGRCRWSRVQDAPVMANCNPGCATATWYHTA